MKANNLNTALAEIDLHCHSNHSDGDLAPAALLARAQAQGVSQLALTDHDCIDGVIEARESLDITSNFSLINGIELSCRWRGIDIHIVGLAFKLEAEALLNCIQSQQHRRLDRSARIAAKLAAKGFPDAYEAAVKAARSPEQITRPHFAQYLVDVGAVKTFPQAFKQYLGYGKPAYVATQWITVEEAVATIHSSGGLAVLAHPSRYKLSNTKLRRLITEFAECGGDALEVVNSNQTDQVCVWLGQLAAEAGLYASQGSDFHGAKMPWAQLGRMPRMPAGCSPIWLHPNWAEALS